MVSAPVDVIPYDEDILDKAHLLDDTKLILHRIVDLCARCVIVLRIALIFLFKAFLAQRIQKFPCACIALRHFILRDLVIAELDLDIAALRDLLRVVDRLRCVAEQGAHLRFALYEELSALVAHTIIIRNLLSGLDAKKHIMRLNIRLIGVVAVVRTYQLDPQLLAHAQKLLVDQLLIGYSMILQFQKEIVFAEAVTVFYGDLFCLLVEATHNVARNLARKTRRQADQALMVLLQRLEVHARAVIIAFRVADGNDLHQIGISGIVLCKQDQMIIAVIAVAALPVEAGVGCHIHLTSNDRADSLRLSFLIKFDHTEHIAVVGDRGTVHPKLFYAGNIILYFVRAI